MSENGQKFPNLFKEIRKEAGRTQDDVVKYLNDEQCISDPKTYRNYEKGDAVPSAKTLCALSDFFKVSTDYLLGRCPDYKTMGAAFVGEHTGLTDNNVQLLHDLTMGRDPAYCDDIWMEIVNAIIGNDLFKAIISSIYFAGASAAKPTIMPDSDTTGESLIFAHDVISAIGGVVLPKEEAIEHYKVQAVEKFRRIVDSIVSDLCDIEEAKESKSHEENLESYRRIKKEVGENNVND